MKDKIIESFDRISSFEDKWDHNRFYSKLVLKEIGRDNDSILDIGCGTGEFTQKVAQRAKRVVGIDISPKMVNEAKKRHSANNITYIVKDFDAIDVKEQYDCIVSIATFHHLSLESILSKIDKMLKPGGVLVVLDLYDRKGLLDFLLDIIAVPTNLIINRIKNGSKRINKDEINVWNEHIKLDKYMTIEELRKVYHENYGWDVMVNRLLFWRYMAVYRKMEIT
ncbi:class I SAM-dependent methyltransferase [Pseudobacteroides cellulosolvens]|uniref:Methyltransferase domain-containing protein n=1 Tax=Pseudobacteroides cellulosolvens ATCC 35603 = DSM 2933 TaxID=398512 RepID=A0A0L6JI14_9FIRM|nr:class I SAM-dependent methyltransferase [Pseudobacteroides cellulosolvens]KNY25122.1 hypothetical protein Bccel_0379 [Pseudobacteroides cellulosolvens ATCC 35603 = DSM 2933]